MADSCNGCNNVDVFSYRCKHKGLNEDAVVNNIREYYYKDTAPVWCPLIIKIDQSDDSDQVKKGKVDICGDFGDPDICHPDVCEEYFNKKCPHEDEVTERYNPHKYNCETCPHEDVDELECGHPRLLNNADDGETARYNEGGFAPTWCPRIRLDEKTKQNNLRRKEMKEDNVKFDFDTATAQVKGNAVNAVDTVKNTLITMQKGKAVITAVKSSLMKAPGCPEGLKVLLTTPYGDMVVGLILHTAAPVITGSPTILKAVKAANVAGAVELSQSITFIQDAIENAIGALPGFEEVKKMAEDKIDQAVGTDYTDGNTKTDG